MDRSRQPGFTLIELMVTLTVVGILVGAAVPNMRDFMRNNRLTGGVNDLLHSLQVARTEAIKRQSGNVVVCGTAAPTVADAALTCDYTTFNGWFVFQDTDGNWQHSAAEPVIERHALLDASITVKTDARDKLVSFAPTGFATLPGVRSNMGTLVMCDSRGVVAASAAVSTARAVLVTATGRARAASSYADVHNVALPLVQGGSCP